MRVAVVLLALASLACVVPPAASPARAPADARRAKPFVAVLDAAVPFGAALAEVDARAFVPLTGVASLRWTGSRHDAERLVALGAARYAEPVQTYRPAFVPADPDLRNQWALADVAAPMAWDLAPSAKGAVVAVVDTGVELHHPDLEGALWTNEAEAPDDGSDDDENGFVDDVHGWDFVDGDGDPSPAPGDVHGTMVAGVVGALSNNGVGISGVAPDVEVMPVRVMTGAGGTSEALADGIDYAVDNGADVVDLSLEGGYSRLVDEALARACGAGVVVVAAAGNDGAASVSFPASSTVAGVLGVAATDRARALAAFSNFGVGVDLTAPGVDVFSTAGPLGYAVADGTSMAAAHVAGAMALRIASRGARDVDYGPMLRSLPRGPGGVPRLDVSAIVEPEPDAVHPGLSSEEHPSPSGPLLAPRARLTFHAVAGSDPPSQSIALGATSRTSFDVDADDWIVPGPCRSAPCTLTVATHVAGLAAGLHRGHVALRPVDGARAVSLEVDLFVAADRSLRLDAVVDGKPAGTTSPLAVTTSSLVAFRAMRAGRPVRAVWQVGGERFSGARISGVFPRRGSVIVRARDGGDEATCVVASDGG